MASERKRWATQYPGSSEEPQRHKTKAETYDWVREEARRWAANRLGAQVVRVLVDERDGLGFRIYDDTNLAEFAGSDVR